MEAVRRLENESGAMQQLKQFATEADPVQTMQRPDVIEINRLTWQQRFAAILGETCSAAYLALTVVFLYHYRGGMGWSSDTGANGDQVGNVRMWNTHVLASVLGLVCLSQAILLYRVLPLNTNPWINRVIYVFFQAAAISAFVVSLVGRIMTTPHGQTTFWGVEDWVFVTALAVSALHGLYSIAVTAIETLMPIEYETWAEMNNKLSMESPEQRRDKSQFNAAGRTIYTPAPVSIPREAVYVPPPNANVGAEVPVAPSNAPRWAENPNTHSENYFLLPRVKWAVAGFVGMGAAVLMEFAIIEHVMATGHSNWSQDGIIETPLKQNSSEATLIGCLGVILIAGVMAIAYAAMPPRTTLVKNGILVDPATAQHSRRSSISNNAETRIGGGNIV